MSGRKICVRSLMMTTDSLNEDDESDWSLNEPVIKSSSEASKVVERQAEFAQFRGLEELSTSFL